MMIDVIILTKNSMPDLVATVNSLVNSDIPLNKIIFVDGFSIDGTIDYIKSLQVPKEIIFDRGTRATARQKGIEAVETKWFMFLDSDVILPRKWYCYAKKYVGKRSVGAIWGTAINIDENDFYRYYTVKKLYKTSIVRIAQLHGERRGYTHDTLIKKEAIEDIKIPRSLHTFEDHYIRRYVEERGYKWIAAFPPYCYHKHNYRGLFSGKNDWLLTGFYGKEFGLYKFSSIFTYLTLGAAKAILVSVFSGKIFSGILQYLIYLYLSTGIIKSALVG